MFTTLTTAYSEKQELVFHILCALCLGVCATQDIQQKKKPQSKNKEHVTQFSSLAVAFYEVIQNVFCVQKL